MINPGTLLDDRRRDKRDVVMPWFTDGALNVIRRWNLDGSVVLEWGGGWSSLWWASRGARVHVIETNREWIEWIGSMSQSGIHCEWRDGSGESYAAIPLNLKPDIAIVDGTHRHLDHIILAALIAADVKRIIVDNWNQPSVCVNADAIELMAKEGGTIYRQRGHPDWQTIIFDSTETWE